MRHNLFTQGKDLIAAHLLVVVALRALARFRVLRSMPLALLRMTTTTGISTKPMVSQRTVAKASQGQSLCLSG
jgi:hypothetical protein